MDRISDCICRENVLQAAAATDSRNVTIVADHLMVATPALEPYRLSTKLVYTAILDRVKDYTRGVLKSLTLSELEYGDGIGMPVDCNVAEWNVGPVDQFFADYPALKDKSHFVPSIKEYRTAIELMEQPKWRAEVEAGLGFLITDIAAVRDAYVDAGSKGMEAKPTPKGTEPEEEQPE